MYAPQGFSFAIVWDTPESWKKVAKWTSAPPAPPLLFCWVLIR